MSAGITSSSDGLSIGLRVNTANVVTFDSSGVMTLIGTGNRITGDFSNATVANRAAFQTSTANSATNLTLLPTGTAARITYEGYSTSDGLNASSFSLGVIPGSGDVTFRSSITGTGTYLPMTFYNGGFEAMRLATTGRLTTNKAASGIVVTLVDGATITPDFDAGNFGLNSKNVNYEMHLFTPDGQLLTGVDAFAHLWSVLPRYRVASKIVKLPLVNSCAWIGYRIFARYRHLLPKKRR